MEAKATYRIENGCIVGYFPGVAPVRTSLKRVARELVSSGYEPARLIVGADWTPFEGLSPDVAGAALDATQGAVEGHFAVSGQLAEVGWGFLKRVKRGLKKVGKKALKATKAVMRVAHKVTHNKVFESIHHAIQKIVPQPYKTLVDLQKPLQKATVKFVEDFSSGKKGARAIAPAIRAAAHGIITSDALAAQAKKLGVPVDEVKAVAAMSKLELEAKGGNPAAKAAKNAMELLDQVARGKPGNAVRTLAEATLRKQLPGSTAHNVTTSNGRKFRVITIPLDKVA